MKICCLEFAYSREFISIYNKRTYCCARGGEEVGEGEVIAC